MPAVVRDAAAQATYSDLGMRTARYRVMEEMPLPD
jgi:hypothetical protein